MSGSTIGGVVGAFVGYWFGNPQLGWMIGSAIGGYVDPEQVQQFGPRLQDAIQQTAQDGISIPFGYGKFPTRGNIIWVQPGPPTEHVNESTDDGKGGPEVTTTTYTYTRSYAIGICQGPITGLLLVKRNGKVVYDTRKDAELTAIGYTAAEISAARMATQAFLLKATIYTGTETQVADATMEAHLGVGNVTAYRGLAYIVVTDDDVTELRGAVPQYEFVVATEGTAAESCVNEGGLVAWWPLDDASGGGSAREVVAGRDGVYSANASPGSSLRAGSGGSLRLDAAEDYMIADYNGAFTVVNDATWTVSAWFTVTDDSVVPSGMRNIATYWQDEAFGYADWGLSLDGTDTMVPDAFYTWGNAIDSSHTMAPDPVSLHSIIFMCFSVDNGVGTLYINGAPVAQDTPAEGPGRVGRYMTVGGGGVPSANGFIGNVSDVKMYNRALSGDEVLQQYTTQLEYMPIPGAPGWFVNHDGEIVLVDGCLNTVESENPLLSEIVADLLERAGLTSDEYDVSALTDEVEGYRVLPNGSGIDASLGPLMQAYFFDVAEWDGKLRCIKRGGASSLSLTMDDLAERDGEAIEWTRVQEAELLRQQTVAYMDPAAGYTPTTQKWERRAGTVQARGEAAAEIPITATADTAAAIAKKRGLLAWAETDKALFSLPYRRSKVTPTDILTLTDAESEAHRLRIMQVEEDSGVLLLEAVKERGNVYTATASGVTPNDPTAPGSGLPGPTILHAMNLPRLRSADNQPGAYMAVTGVMAAWKGADIYVSADGGVSEQFAKRITARATMGWLADDCTASGEPITVRLFDGRAVSSITAEQLAARQNAFAIDSDGTCEVGQFQTAAANGDHYDLTDTVRGALGTTAASHVEGDEFALLDSAVAFVPLDISLAGQTLILRAVSIGTSPDDNETIEFTFLPQFTGPEETNYLLDESGAQLLDEAGGYLLE